MSESSMSSIQEVEEFGADPNGTGHRSWAFGLLLVVVVGLAALVQTIARVFDLDWLAMPLVSSVAVGALLVVAVQVPPLRGRLQHQLLEILAGLVPAVRIYIAQRDAAATRLRGNAQRMTNLRQIVKLNALQPVDPSRRKELGGASDDDITYDKMIERVVDDVFPVAMRQTYEHNTLDYVLQLLYLDAHPVDDQKQNLWTERREILLDPLTDVLLGTDHVRRTAATWREARDELNALVEFSTSALLDRLSQVSTNEAIRMRRVLDRYSIPRLTGTTWTDADWAQIEFTARARGGNQITQCARLCANRIKRSPGGPLSPHLLRLLYLESYSPNNAGFWKKHGATLVGELAELLAAGELLPDYVSPDFREASTLERLLTEHRYYSVQLIRDEIEVLDRLRLTLNDFARFLDAEGFVVPKVATSARSMIDHLEHDVRGGLPREERDVERVARADSEMQLLFAFGANVIRRTPKAVESATWSPTSGMSLVTPLPTSLVDGIALAALHLHVCREGPATPDAHVALARMTRSRTVQAQAAALVLAARSIMQKNAAHRVSLRDVAGRWARELASASAAAPTRLHQQIDQEQRLLETVTGVTPPPSAAPSRDVSAEPIVEQLVEVRATLDDLDGVLHQHRADHQTITNRITLLNSDVDALAHEVHDDHEWLVRPYLLTYDKDAGPLAELIDPLASPTTAERDVLHRLRVRDRDDDQTYRFANLTRQTRLGFLPKHVPFDEFMAELERDLDIVLRHREEVLGYRIVCPGATTAISVGGPPPLRITRMPRHGSVVLDTQRRRVNYTPFPIDFRGRDRLVVEDDAGVEHVLELAVRPDLRRIEVTLSRVHLAQFGELVIDRAGQPSIAREPSVLGVIRTLKERGQLTRIELDVIERHLGQIVGPNASSERVRPGV